MADEIFGKANERNLAKQKKQVQKKDMMDYEVKKLESNLNKWLLGKLGPHRFEKVSLSTNETTFSSQNDIENFVKNDLQKIHKKKWKLLPLSIQWEMAKIYCDEHNFGSCDMQKVKEALCTKKINVITYDETQGKVTKINL